MCLVLLGLKMTKKKEIFNFFHIISFLNSQSTDYYVFSTITMITLNTAKCGTQKQQDEIIVLIGILHLLCPNSAPIISNYIKLLQN